MVAARGGPTVAPVMDPPRPTEPDSIREVRRILPSGGPCPSRFAVKHNSGRPGTGATPRKRKIPVGHLLGVGHQVLIPHPVGTLAEALLDCQDQRHVGRPELGERHRHVAARATRVWVDPEAVAPCWACFEPGGDHIQGVAVQAQELRAGETQRGARPRAPQRPGSCHSSVAFPAAGGRAPSSGSWCAGSRRARRREWPAGRSLVHFAAASLRAATTRWRSAHTLPPAWSRGGQANSGCASRRTRNRLDPDRRGWSLWRDQPVAGGWAWPEPGRMGSEPGRAGSEPCPDGPAPAPGGSPPTPAGSTPGPVITSCSCSGGCAGPGLVRRLPMLRGGRKTAGS